MNVIVCRARRKFNNNFLDLFPPAFVEQFNLPETGACVCGAFR